MVFAKMHFAIWFAIATFGVNSYSFGMDACEGIFSSAGGQSYRSSEYFDPPGDRAAQFVALETYVGLAVHQLRTGTRVERAAAVEKLRDLRLRDIRDDLDAGPDRFNEVVTRPLAVLQAEAEKPENADRRDAMIIALIEYGRALSANSTIHPFTRVVNDHLSMLVDNTSIPESSRRFVYDEIVRNQRNPAPFKTDADITTARLAMGRQHERSVIEIISSIRRLVKASKQFLTSAHIDSELALTRYLEIEGFTEIPNLFGRNTHPADSIRNLKEQLQFGREVLIEIRHSDDTWATRKRSINGVDQLSEVELQTSIILRGTIDEFGSDVTLKVPKSIGLSSSRSGAEYESFPIDGNLFSIVKVYVGRDASASDRLRYRWNTLRRTFGI